LFYIFPVIDLRMATKVTKLQVGKEVYDLAGSTKHSITLPTKKTMPIKKLTFDKPKGKLTGRQKHIRKMAENYLQCQYNKSATRRAKAMKIVRLKDGRKVYFKAHTNQTKDSMALQSTKPKTRSASALKDNRDMMCLVRRMKNEYRNKLRKEQLKKAGKAEKFKPTTLGGVSTLPEIVKKYYGPEPKKTTAVKITNLPESVDRKTLKIALGSKCSKYVKDLTIYDSKDKKDAAKKMKVALIKTDSEDFAKDILKQRSGKMKLSGKLAKLRVVAPPQKMRKAPETERKAKEERRAKMKARSAAIRKGNHERHMKNQADAKRRRNSRRHPKYPAAKVYRDNTGRVYAIRPAHKTPKIERKRVNKYKAIKAMVRATRK